MRSGRRFVVVPAKYRDIALLSLAATMGLGPTERIPYMSASHAGAEALLRLRLAGCRGFTAREFREAFIEACRELGGDRCDAREAAAELSFLLRNGVLRPALAAEVKPCARRARADARAYALTEFGELALGVYEAVRPMIPELACRDVPCRGAGVECLIPRLLCAAAHAPERRQQLFAEAVWRLAERDERFRRLVEALCARPHGCSPKIGGGQPPDLTTAPQE